MKNFKKYFFLPCLVLMLSGCTDLEETLNGTVTEDITVAGVPISEPEPVPASGPLDAAYGELRGAGTANHGGYYSVQELTSDEMLIGAKGGDWFDGGILIELHRHTYTPGHAFVNNTWVGTYNAINTCNELIAGSLDADNMAQARVLRAYYYRRLLDLYGNVKIVTQSGVDAPQSPRGEVFDFVESEILDALSISAVTAGMDLSGSALSTDNSNAFKINLYGALGILSRLYLNAEVWKGTAMYDEAAIAAGYIIDMGPYTLCGDGCTVKNLGKREGVPTDPDELEGYAAVFAPNNYGNPEHIFSVYYNEAAAGGMNFAMMNLHYSSQFTWNFDAQPWNGYSTLEEFYNSYDDADVRKANNFIVGPQIDFSGSAVLDYASDDDDIQLNYTPSINELTPNHFREAGARAGKFSFKQFGRPDMDNDYPIIRLGQVYLMRAEALARAAGDWSLALNDVNEIRKRAKVGEYASIDADEFLAERGREMYQEAERRTDLIRFGKYNDAWWEKPASAAHTTLFPIPQDQINAAGGTLSQNPGY